MISDTVSPFSPTEMGLLVNSMTSPDAFTLRARSFRRAWNFPRPRYVSARASESERFGSPLSMVPVNASGVMRRALRFIPATLFGMASPVFFMVSNSSSPRRYRFWAWIMSRIYALCLSDRAEKYLTRAVSFLRCAFIIVSMFMTAP